jgi:perosamine synthetase
MVERVSNLEREYVEQVLDSEFRGSKSVGMVGRAERAFADMMESTYAIGFVNGTGTLHTALEVLGVGPGDEVIVPPLTMSATAFSVLQANATPIFADVDLETFQISASSIGERITENTKAIMSVSLYGGSPDYDSIRNVSGDLPIVGDNAEAFGTKYKGKEISSLTEFSSYSFQSSKHLTSGEGGMLCTDSLDLADKARKFQSLGYSAVGATTHKIDKKDIQDPKYLRHEMLGWNYRMNDLTAAVVLGQIERAEELISVRKKTGQRIFAEVKDVEWLKPQEIYPGTEHSFWAAPLLLVREDLTWHQFRNKFAEFGGKGIYAAWQLSYLEPVFKDLNFMGREKFISVENSSRYKAGYCPNAEYLQPRILAFRTNEWDEELCDIQIGALRKTIDYFNS